MLCLLTSQVSATPQIIKSNVRTCYDFSIEYSKNNPDWGVVTLSNNCLFRGVSHDVNYKLNKTDGSLDIHDGLYSLDYTIYDWHNVYFYHFWVDQTPIRTYNFLRDNKDVVLNEC
jgi:hypothetical protein